MKKVFCDRCGEEIINKTGANFAPSEVLGPFSVVGFDLCAECLRNLNKWFGEKGK